MKPQNIFAFSFVLFNACVYTNDNQLPKTSQVLATSAVKFRDMYAAGIKAKSSDIEILLIRRNGINLDPHIDVSNESKTFYELGAQLPGDILYGLKEDSDYRSSTRKE